MSSFLKKLAQTAQSAASAALTSISQMELALPFDDLEVPETENSSVFPELFVVGNRVCIMSASPDVINKARDDKKVALNLKLDFRHKIFILDEEPVAFPQSEWHHVSFSGLPFPPLPLLFETMHYMERFRNADNENVVVLYSNDHFGRSIAIASCFLCWCGEESTPMLSYQAIMDHFQTQEVASGHLPPIDPLSPSQIRYLMKYFGLILEGIRPTRIPTSLISHSNENILNLVLYIRRISISSDSNLLFSPDGVLTPHLSPVKTETEEESSVPHASTHHGGMLSSFTNLIGTVSTVLEEDMKNLLSSSPQDALRRLLPIRPFAQIYQDNNICYYGITTFSDPSISNNSGGVLTPNSDPSPEGCCKNTSVEPIGTLSVESDDEDDVKVNGKTTHARSKSSADARLSHSVSCDVNIPVDPSGDILLRIRAIDSHGSPFTLCRIAMNTGFLADKTISFSKREMDIMSYDPRFPQDIHVTLEFGVIQRGDVETLDGSTNALVAAGLSNYDTLINRNDELPVYFSDGDDAKSFWADIERRRQKNHANIKSAVKPVRKVTSGLTSNVSFPSQEAYPGEGSPAASGEGDSQVHVPQQGAKGFADASLTSSISSSLSSFSGNLISSVVSIGSAVAEEVRLVAGERSDSLASTQNAAKAFAGKISTVIVDGLNVLDRLEESQHELSREENPSSESVQISANSIDHDSAVSNDFIKDPHASQKKINTEALEVAELDEEFAALEREDQDRVASGSANEGPGNEGALINNLNVQKVVQSPSPGNGESNDVISAMDEIDSVLASSGVDDIKKDVDVLHPSTDNIVDSLKELEDYLATLDN